MAIKTFVEDLEGIPEGLHEHYKETDKGFVLEVDGIREHPDVTKLSNAYTRVKEAERAARDELKNLQERADSLPEDFDPDLWNKAKSGDLEAGLVKVRKELEADLQKERDRSSGLEQSLRSLTVDRALSEALDGANITNPAYRKAATALLKDAVKLDGDSVYVDSDMGPLEPAEYVKKWAATDEGKPFVAQPSGGGSKSGNPTVTPGPKSWDEAKTREEKTEFIRNKLSA